MKRTRNLYHYAIRKCKKSVEQIKKNKLLDACISGKGSIFDEFRKIRHVKRDLPQIINGSNNIPDEFANVNKKLYNSTQDQVETLKILGNVNISIDILSLKDVTQRCIFNTHFYGVPLWDLFSPAFQQLEKTWNTSRRLMLSLRTHRYLIEPLTGRPHIITSLWKRFLKFINCVSLSQKAVLRTMLHLAKQDCRLITGRNRRKIELVVNQDDNANKHLPPYCMISDNEKWRIREIMDPKSGIIEVANFTTEELDTINEFVCCSSHIGKQS